LRNFSVRRAQILLKQDWEKLLDIWLEKNIIPYIEQDVSFLEKQNWLKKGGLFLER
jgi:hypothetical protein